MRRGLFRNNGLPAPEATCEGNSRRRSRPKRITLGRGEQSLRLDNASVIVEVRAAGERGGEEATEEMVVEDRARSRDEGGGGWKGGVRARAERSEISEMTDTRFHPVEVTTMFVSRRYAGTQATFPSRFPVKLMTATS